MIGRRSAQPSAAEVELRELRQRLTQAEREISELRGELRAMGEHQRRERAAFEGELGRVLDLIRAPVPGAGLEAIAARLTPQQPPSPQRDAFRSRWAEVHGAGISQEEMIARQEKRYGREETPAVEG